MPDNKLTLNVLDATLRDGGLVNNFEFDDELVRNIYAADILCGVDYMEFGYRADKKQSCNSGAGKWKYSSDDDIRAVIGAEKGLVKTSVMVDVGFCDYRSDIHPRSESPLDMIRVATYIDTLPEAIRIVEHASALGYETTCNIMSVSTCSHAQLVEALKALAQSPVMAVYVVDSHGALYPRAVGELVDLYCEYMSAAGKKVGIHAHNNQQCAFANTIEARDRGAVFLDGTAYGMGRGAGNCPMEAILGLLEGGGYHIEPMLDLIQSTMQPLRASGLVWGYDTPYLLTALKDKHPRTAIEAIRREDHNYRAQYRALTDE